MASDTNLTAIRAAAPGDTGEKTVFKILLTISFCHLLNDTLQSLIPAIYQLLKNSYHLDFGQVGLIALTLQLTASVNPIPSRWAWASPCPACWLWRWPPATRRSSLRRASWVLAPQCFTRNLRASRAWPPADSTAWRNRFSRSAATPAPRSVRSSPPSC